MILDVAIDNVSFLYHLFQNDQWNLYFDVLEEICLTVSFL